MSYAATVYKVMIASPGDINGERRIVREVIADWNSAHSETRGIVLMPIGWETHSVPEMGDRPQEIINKQVLNGCDILVGVFWTRIGTPTGKYDSGTIEEIEEHIKAGKPAMLYFSNVPIRPDNVNQVQYTKLVNFKKSLQDRGLYCSYNEKDEFRKLLSKHLPQKMNQPQYYTQNFNKEPEGLLTLSAPVVPNLSKEALSLLIEISKDKRGTIKRVLTNGFLSIITNRKFILRHNNIAREKALWEEVFDRLKQENLIHDFEGSGQTFKLTKRGYDLADLLEQ
jgi:hypothetical protein